MVQFGLLRQRVALQSLEIVKTLINTRLKIWRIKKYVDRYNLKGGIVRQDKQSGELCICSDQYSDDIGSDCWSLLSDVL